MLRMPVLVVIVLLSSLAACGWCRETHQPVPEMSMEEAIESLGSPDRDARRQGAIFLIAQGADAKQAVPAIVEIIRREAPDVPMEPMAVLEQLGPDAKDAVPAIVENLKKYAPDVQYGFLHVLFAIGPAGKAAVPSLIKVARSEDFHHRYLAYKALGQMGDASKPAVGALIKGLQSDVAS